jgi:hypothetical protein
MRDPATAAAGRRADAAEAGSGGDKREPAAGGAAPANANDDTEADLDAGVGEPSASCAPFELPADCETTAPRTAPSSLHCTALYAELERGLLACGLLEYTPAYELWSDGAVKRRWVSLPAGASIDTSDPDAFAFPVGTQFWKEFRVPVNGDLRRAETRYLRKEDAGWVYTTYVWSEDGRSAKQQNYGVSNWAGSGHIIPTRDQCVACHAGRSDMVLGWDALLLGPGAKGLHIGDLNVAAPDAEDAGVPADGTVPPGDEIERAALGYLHVNCGVSCHNCSGVARARNTGLYLDLPTGRHIDAAEAPAVTTAINRVPMLTAAVYEIPAPPEGSFYELLPGSSARSLLLARMKIRGLPASMPPMASKKVDDAGIAAVTAWIEHMTEERGYPAAAP